MLKFFFIILLCLLNHIKIDCFKILVFNHILVPSHTNFMINIANLLSQAGHDVTIIHSPAEIEIYDKNVKGPKIVKPSKILQRENQDINLVVNNHSENVWTSDFNNPLIEIETLKKLASKLADNCKNVIQDDILTQKIKEEKFDLGISEVFAPCGLGVLKYYNISNTISVQSGCAFDSHYESLGLTVPVSQVATSIAPLSMEMNIFERLINLGSYLGLKKIYYDAIEIGNEMFRETYPEEKIDLHQLFKKTAFYVDNCDPLLNYGLLSTPKFLHLGGFLIPNPKPLSKEFDNVLNKQKRNVLISFGSFTKSSAMPINIKKNFVRLFKEYPDITFLWKYDGDDLELFKEVDNVFISKWMPQIDLLADPRMSLFITHGGMNSFLEAGRYGVPLLPVPLFGDQPKNAKIIEELKLGRTVGKFELSDNYEKLKEVFDDVLNNDLYKKTSRKISHMIEERPNNLKETFIKYAEFAAIFGNVEHFTIPGADIPYWKYFYLDIVSILIGTIVFIIIIVKMIIKKLKNFLCNKKKNQKID